MAAHVIPALGLLVMLAMEMERYGLQTKQYFSSNASFNTFTFLLANIVSRHVESLNSQGNMWNTCQD